MKYEMYAERGRKQFIHFPLKPIQIDIPVPPLVL